MILPASLTPRVYSLASLLVSSLGQGFSWDCKTQIYTRKCVSRHLTALTWTLSSPPPLTCSTEEGCIWGACFV